MIYIVLMSGWVGEREGVGAQGCTGARVCVQVSGKGRVDEHRASDGADDGDITNAPDVTKSLFFSFLSFFCNR